MHSVLRHPVVEYVWKKETSINLQEHHKSRQCQQVFQKRGQLPRITRAFSAVYFCCDRISSLPNCSVYMDGLIGSGYIEKLLEMSSSSPTKALQHLPLLTLFVIKHIVAAFSREIWSTKYTFT